MKTNTLALLSLILLALTTKAQTRALNFDGVNDHVNLGSTLPVGTKGTFTIECWINIEELSNVQGQNPIYGEYSTAVGGFGFTANYFIVRDDGKVVFDQYTPIGGNFESNTSLQVNKWYHIAYVKDGASQTENLYINGVLDATRQNQIEAPTLREFALIGARQGTGATPRYFDGTIDEFRIWDVARSQQEIENYMYSELINVPANLGLYLKFNEGTTNGNNTSVTSLIDDSPNALTGISAVGFNQSGSFSNWSEGALLRIYVKQDATGNSDGGTWVNAYNSLDLALLKAQASQEVWVSAGVYKPTSSTLRNVSFVIKDSVVVRGGFEGDEVVTYDINSRNFYLNETILSGDIGVQGDSTDNSYHVVRVTEVTKETMIDGFTIKDGNANSSTPGLTETSGGGLLNSVNTTIGATSIVTVTNCIFRNNYADVGGGGMASMASGGGHASALITNTIFEANRAQFSGAGLYFASLKEGIDYKLENLAIVGNRATGGGGAGGGLTLINDSGNLSISMVNCTYTGNIARYGGAIRTVNNSTSFSLNIVNTVVSKNVAYQWGETDLRSSIEESGSTTSATSTFQNSLIVGSNSTTNGNIPGTTDPQFLNTINPFNAPSLAIDFRLQPCSPVINAGVVAGAPNRDVYNRQRCDIPDMGAHEFKGSTSSTLIYVSQQAVPGGNGTSWVDAFNDIQDALVALGTCGTDSIWVAKGTYYTTHTNDRDKAFNLIKNTIIRGGFEGVEPANYNLSLRDFDVNETILSGDIGVQGDSLDNSYSIFTLDRVAQNSEIDGFSLEKALANGSSTFFRSGGAGIGVWSRGVIINLKVKNCTFRDLVCTSSGAGILNTCSQSGQGNLIVENSRFLNGNAGFSGGAIINEGSFGGAVNAEIKNSFIQGNSGGGAIRNTAYNDGEAILRVEGSVITGNETGSRGAGIYNTQSHPTDDNATISIVNCTVAANKSFQGAGFQNDGGTAYVTNSIFWNNDADSDAGVGTGNGGTTTISYCMVQGLNTNANSNIPSVDPKFTFEVPGSLAPTVAGDFSLKLCSPMIDKGTNDSLSTGYNLDLIGNSRLVNGNSLPQAKVDLGAYEFQVPIIEPLLQFTDDISSEVILRAGVLEASSGVISPANILYHGDNHVLLKPGFYTQSDVVFEAKAGPFTCPN